MLYLLLVLIIIFNCVMPASAHHNPTFGFAGTAGPILTNPASTILKGHWGVGVRLEYVNFNELSTDAIKFFAKKKRFTHSGEYFLSPALGVAYGATDNLTLAVRIPYNVQGNIVDGVLRMDGRPDTQPLGTADGLGDISLFAQYRFLNLKDKAFESAVLTGITIPSGLAHVKDKLGNRFGADHQPSKRSFEPLVGLAITKRFGHKLSLDSNYLYTKAVNGIQDFYSGDLHNYNVAFSYRLLEPHHHHHHVQTPGNMSNHTHEHFYGAPFQENKFDHLHSHKHRWDSKFGIDTILELNGEWRQKQVFNATGPSRDRDLDSGGHLLYLTPGVRLAVGENWAGYYSFGLPIFQDPNGKGQKSDFRIICGVSRSF